MKNHFTSNVDPSLESTLASIGATVIIGILIFLVMMFALNGGSSKDWNDGYCPKCNERYELRAANNFAKYYVCPECGKEVKRF